MVKNILFLGILSLQHYLGFVVSSNMGHLHYLNGVSWLWLLKQQAKMKICSEESFDLYFGFSWGIYIKLLNNLNIQQRLEIRT